MRKIKPEEVIGGAIGAIVYGVIVGALYHFLGPASGIGALASGLSYWSWYALKRQDVI